MVKGFKLKLSTLTKSMNCIIMLLILEKNRAKTRNLSIFTNTLFMNILKRTEESIEA